MSAATKRGSGLLGLLLWSAAVGCGPTQPRPQQPVAPVRATEAAPAPVAPVRRSKAEEVARAAFAVIIRVIRGMTFEKSNPILYSRDVKRSLKFYTEILGFDDSWEWGTPTDFGGVVKDDVEIFFCLNDQGHPGTWIAYPGQCRRVL